ENLERLVIDAFTTGVVLVILGSIRARLAEQARVEVALRAEAETERARVSAMMESVTDGFFSVDASWRYRFVNGRAERIVDRKREELLGTTIWEAFPTMRGSIWERELRRAVKTREPVHFEAFYPPLDSWFETHAYPASD